MSRPLAGRPATAPLVLVGFEGKTVPPHLARWLRENAVGGVVLFSRNLEGPVQVRELCREIKAAKGPGPLPLIAIDQEGGRVRRLRDSTFTSFPPARSLSALEGARALRAAWAAGAATAAEVAAVGIDVNFAPVLDVDSNPRNPVIGDRAISDDPAAAAALGIAWARGSLAEGVIPVGKHFPGHGATEADSHEELPVVGAPRDLLFSRELVPFRAAIAAGIPALMTAHVLYPALDPDAPATLSRPIVTDLLRRRLGFRGVVFSDALEMRAIARHLPIGEAALLAAAAGCDALLVCRGEEAQQEVIFALARARREKPAFRRAAEASRMRLSRLLETLARIRPRRLDLRRVGARRHRDLAALLERRLESIGRTPQADRPDNIGEG